jgi:hypothetical protein
MPPVVSTLTVLHQTYRTRHLREGQNRATWLSSSLPFLRKRAGLNPPLVTSMPESSSFPSTRSFLPASSHRQRAVLCCAPLFHAAVHVPACAQARPRPLASVRPPATASLLVAPRPRPHCTYLALPCTARSPPTRALPVQGDDHHTCRTAASRCALQSSYDTHHSHTPARKGRKSSSQPILWRVRSPVHWEGASPRNNVQTLTKETSHQ